MFVPVGHSHLMRCALKLVPSVPIATVKWVMFVFLLEVLNDVSPHAAFFTPHHHPVPHAWRTHKPKESGAQPVEAMALDAPSPITPDLTPPLDPMPYPLGN